MAEPLRDPKHVQAMLDEFQAYQRQLQVLMMQRQQMEAQNEEMKSAIEALKGATGNVYQLIGGLMIETTKEAAKKDMAEKVETSTVRIGAMQKQEEKVRAKLTSMRTELEKEADEARKQGGA